MNDYAFFEEQAGIYIASLVEQASGEASPVVLTGSAARSMKPGLWSDIDLLVLDLDARDAPAVVHVIQMKTPDFVSKMRSGDDVVQWAARFGKPLQGEKRWRDLVSTSLGAAPWPDFLPKVRQAERRLKVGRELLGAGDCTSAQKELVYAVSHLARAILLSKGIFPLSRPELPEQLESVGEAAVAGVLERVSSVLIESMPELEDVARLVDDRQLRLGRRPVGSAT